MFKFLWQPKRNEENTFREKLEKVRDDTFLKALKKASDEDTLGELHLLMLEDFEG